MQEYFEANTKEKKNYVPACMKRGAVLTPPIYAHYMCKWDWQRLTGRDVSTHGFEHADFSCKRSPWVLTLFCQTPSSSFSPCRKPACIKIIHGEGQAGERQEELPEHRRVCVLDRTQQDLKDLYRGGKYQREPVLHFEWNQ